MSTVPRILFVCLGNICRSPTAEAVFHALMPESTVDSAGTGGWHVGEAPYGPMQRAAQVRGYDLSKLRARQFILADFDRFDLIMGMDAENVANIEAMRPAGNQTPVHLFTDYVLSAEVNHVPDPYYTRDFDGTLNLIEQAAERLKTQLT